MSYKSGCMICGEELIYSEFSKYINCFYCKGRIFTNVKCKNGHYVCDKCHSISANDLIEKNCINADFIEPLHFAEKLMKHPSVKLHGPEHHFLVPAVLLAYYFNKENLNKKRKKVAIQKARKRSEYILGGFCGTHGNCGAAVGTGIFYSIISEATPLSEKEWEYSNMLTANTLSTIANYGGPRCCKRNSFLALITVLDYLFSDKTYKKQQFKCTFRNYNEECTKTRCPFFHDN